MSTKLLGGFAQGFVIQFPKGSLTRPTSVMLKRKIFDSFQSFENYSFVDLCAGSGSIGLEAASRYSCETLFVEKFDQPFRILKQNIQNFEAKYNQSTIKYKKMPISVWLDSHLKIYLEQTKSLGLIPFIFFDPPYEKIDMYYNFFEALESVSFVGYAVVEACTQKTMHYDEFTKLFGEADRKYKQGTSFLNLYEYNR